MSGKLLLTYLLKGKTRMFPQLTLARETILLVDEELVSVKSFRTSKWTEMST